MSDPIKLTDEVLDRIIVSVPDSNGLLRIDMTVVDAIRALRDAAQNVVETKDALFEGRRLPAIEAMERLAALLPDSEVKP